MPSRAILPRIRKLPEYGIWECRFPLITLKQPGEPDETFGGTWGQGYTPRSAYYAWQRNHTQKLRCPQ